MHNTAQNANFNRPPRQPLPAMPIEEIDIPPPPRGAPPPTQNWIISVLPVMGIGVLAVFYVWRAAVVRGSSALFAIPLFVLAVFAISATILANRWRHRDHERQQATERLDYIRTLEKKRARLQAAHNAQVGILNTAFPHANTGLDRALSRETHLWERRPEDGDFMAVRLGPGFVHSPIPVKTPDPDANSTELDRALRLADAYRLIKDAPLVMPLKQQFAAGVCGRRDLMIAAVRAMLTHLTLSHAPTDLQLFLVAPPANRDDWDWMSWLPHTRDGQLLAFDPAAVRVLLGNLSETIDIRRDLPTGGQPHLLLVLDNPQLVEHEAVFTTLLREGGQLGASVLCLTNVYENIPGECSAVVQIYNNGAFRYSDDSMSDPLRGEQIDTLSPTDAAHIARALSSVTLREIGLSGRIPQRVPFLDLYGARQSEDLRTYLRESWTRPVSDGVLPFPVPIGRESLTTNTYLLLDEENHGPHGMLAGTTGSGKSELLQTLVCALAIEHDPRLVNFLLIDFKGGSTFNAFANLPHTVGMVTNLDGALVERALEALKAETRYRQQFLKQLGLRDITQYYRYHSHTHQQISAPEYQPLPHLFIIVDEFAQLAREMPEFLSELVRTAQVGRSLGLHLILGTQSPMDVITDEMNANMQFRICLRVQNVEASRAMLRRPDAAYLPAGLAGRGYFQVGERDVYKQFQTAYAGADYNLGDGDGEASLLELLLPDGTAVNLMGVASADNEQYALLSQDDLKEPYTTAAAVIDVIRSYAKDQHIMNMPPLLLPPLEGHITLYEPFVQMDFGGWNGEHWVIGGHDENGIPIHPGSAPVGMVDDVYTRQQYPLWVHLSTDEVEPGRSGHLMVVGGPGSGKTTLLATLALSEAMLHSPDDLHIYFLSFTGGSLSFLNHLPHAERVVYGTETERVRRLFSRLIKTLNERQASRRREHRPLILLCVDQYEQLRDTYYEQHMPDFDRLISEGRSAGIFVAFTASTVSAIPDRTRSLVQQRIALQLANTADYLVAVGQVNTGLERRMPRGRGFITGTPPLTCQVCLPGFSQMMNDEQIEKQARRLVNDMRQGYARVSRMQGPEAITELPGAVPLASLPFADPAPDRIVTAIGQVDDDALSAYTLDWTESGPHFIITGPPASGKTNLLNAAVLAAATTYPPERVRFLLVDLAGRSLRDLEPLKHVIARVTNPLEMETEFANLEAELMAVANGRLTPLPRTVVIIDDYEIAADVMSMNLELMRQLRDHVRLHTEAGLHIWVAGYLERVGDPLIKQLLLRRSGFALRERESLHNLNVRVANLPNDVMPTGRAFFAQHNRVMVIQTALVDDVAEFVNHINNGIWPDSAAAEWTYPRGRSLPHPDTETLTSNGGRASLDIDTAGLIEDLLGGDDNHE